MQPPVKLIHVHIIYYLAAARMVFEKLPSSVRPVNYKLRIQPDLLKLSFEGEEQIELDASIYMYLSRGQMVPML